MCALNTPTEFSVYVTELYHSRDVQTIIFTLAHSHSQSNTKIMIRGKGATKEGKFGRFGLPQPGEDEELHALITGTSPEVVKLAVDKVSSRPTSLTGF